MVKISKAAADEKLQQAYSMYGVLLTKYCTVRLGEAIASVDDCIQNAFLIYYNKILNGETIENPKAFLYRVADNMVKRCVSEYYSDAKRRADLETAENISVDESFERTADLDYDYLKEILINKLSEDEQLLYQQKYVQRLSLAKHGGIIYAAYCNNDTCMYKMFYKRKILGLLKKGMIDENYHARSSPNEIFEFYRKPDIDHLMKDYNVTRLHFVGVDMLSYLYSNDLDKLNKREFNEYMKFLSTICEREDLTGFSIHMLDIFRKN